MALDAVEKEDLETELLKLEEENRWALFFMSKMHSLTIAILSW